ncbi:MULTISPECIES: YeiH family protein [unclassified Sphingobium]|uniref:YeiH family protein n=1 Tax=unclassified Sphingobium TaxID=2611147 RepID=UPI0022247C0D|nr:MULTISPECIES: putative sulfate exporter family transporter [unclassified Sphingobium]MCW2416153.1 putative integral membrane protein (TIGR00698 family) [Sphingobium sp. B8D3A]
MIVPLSPPCRLSIWERRLPGLILCLIVACAAVGIERLEVALLDKAWLDAIVIAILAGTTMRTGGLVQTISHAGIDFAGRFLLEVAVMLMGASISFSLLAGVGLPLVGGIVALVILMIVCSFAIGRMLGLPTKMAVLVAGGNAICGNSAIAAIAPAIEADCEDVASAVAFTAVLGVILVLLLPVITAALSLSSVAGGALAGLTVYAVPQVIAAAAPLGAVAVQFGTVVKLIRVMMLGPVVLVLSLLYRRRMADNAPHNAGRNAAMIPWFIIGFLGMAALRSVGIIPDWFAEISHSISITLTIIAMAALGLSVDVRDIRAAGARVSLTVILSLILLIISGVAVIHAVGLH